MRQRKGTWKTSPAGVQYPIADGIEVRIIPGGEAYIAEGLARVKEIYPDATPEQQQTHAMVGTLLQLWDDPTWEIIPDNLPDLWSFSPMTIQRCLESAYTSLSALPVSWRRVAGDKEILAVLFSAVRGLVPEKNEVSPEAVATGPTSSDSTS